MVGASHFSVPQGRVFFRLDQTLTLFELVAPSSHRWRCSRRFGSCALFKQRSSVTHNIRGICIDRSERGTGQISKVLSLSAICGLDAESIAGRSVEADSRPVTGYGADS